MTLSIYKEFESESYLNQTLGLMFEKVWNSTLKF